MGSYTIWFTASDGLFFLTESRLLLILLSWNPSKESNQLNPLRTRHFILGLPKRAFHSVHMLLGDLDCLSEQFAIDIGLLEHSTNSHSVFVRRPPVLICKIDITPARQGKLQEHNVIFTDTAL